MSPRAACRLETLGFAAVYDYALGKYDWLAHALPTETGRTGRRAGDVMRADAATCRLDEPAATVRDRIEASPYGFALVLADDRTVLGRLRRSALADPGEASVEELMEPGPSTVRPHADLQPLVERLRERGLRTAVVTTPEGTLLGVVHRDDGG